MNLREEIAAMVVEAATRNYVQVHLSDKEQDFSCCTDLSSELGHTVARHSLVCQRRQLRGSSVQDVDQPAG